MSEINPKFRLLYDKTNQLNPKEKIRAKDAIIEIQSKVEKLLNSIDNQQLNNISSVI